MPAWLEVFFEILKFTIPALVMFLAVRNLFQEFLQGQQQLRILEMQQNRQDQTVPLRLQAYERLSLFCERIQIPNLIRRLETDGMQAGGLKLAMLMAIQQEYEHNLSQQVYVSEKLWDIIKLAQTNTINLILTTAENVEPYAPARDLSRELLKIVDNQEQNPLNTALSAIRKEAGLIFG